MMCLITCTVFLKNDMHVIFFVSFQINYSKENLKWTISSIVFRKTCSITVQIWVKCLMSGGHFFAELPPSSSKAKQSKVVLYDHRPLKLNEDDYERVCRIPKKKVFPPYLAVIIICIFIWNNNFSRCALFIFLLNFIMCKGANFRDLPGVRVRPDKKVEWDPDIERVYLKSGKPLVLFFLFNDFCLFLYIFSLPCCVDDSYCILCMYRCLIMRCLLLMEAQQSKDLCW